MKFLYACYGKAGLDCLYQLLSQSECNPEDILAVTYDDEGSSDLLKALENMEIRYSTDSINSDNLLDSIKEFSPDYLFSIYYRDIIRKRALGMVKKASVNLHPSLLPDYKGCFSAPWVLINGEERTGISYHLIDEGVDSGDIVLQKGLDIEKADTAFSLYHRLVALGSESFSEMFDLLVRQDYSAVAQEPGGRSYRRKVPYDGYISLDWSREQVERFIRAMYFPPYEGARLSFGGEVFEFKDIKEFDLFCAKSSISLK
ncbi:MAG: formyltransferase family protein [Thermodesulfobacteriota bacterium]